MPIAKKTSKNQIISAVLTMSCRLHACVAALAYGRSAMLFSASPRVRLLELLGLGDIARRAMALDPGLLAWEHGGLVGSLRQPIASV